MYHVSFVCPECEHSTDAPLTGIIDGDAGVWACEACGRAFQIEIKFSEVKALCLARDRAILARYNPVLQRN
jgi:transcription elongation factor Elf1